MIMKPVIGYRFSVFSRCPSSRITAPVRRRSGITLTEILIAIMILGIGLVSLATLFPIGLLRLRDAARWSRSATLLQTAASDAVSRGLFSSHSFQIADQLNYRYNLPPWYTTASLEQYNPLVQDTPFYGGDWFTTGQNGTTVLGAQTTVGPGLPFAYDPLWRYQTIGPNGANGYYLDPLNQSTFEARFGYGLTTVRPDPTGGFPSAHGLQRITNFNRAFATFGGGQVAVMPGTVFVPNIFVSQEDVVWQDPNNTTYTVNGASGGTPVIGPSPVVPDLSPPAGSVNAANGGFPSLDWRFTWMYTGELVNAGNSSIFDGNIVIFENRPFGISTPASLPFPQAGAELPGRRRDGRRGGLRIQQQCGDGSRLSGGVRLGGQPDCAPALADQHARPGRSRRRLDRRRDLRASANGRRGPLL